MKRYTSILCIAAWAFTAVAQDLHTEITVDRTVQPVLRDMIRISGLTPTIPAPNVTIKDLQVAEYTEPGVIDSQIGVLPPVAWADSIAHAPYRGYASVGYLPLLNIEANAGYRFVDKPRFGLGMWAQYNSNSYNGDIPYFNSALFTNHIATVGGNLSARFSKNARFEGSGYATYKSIRIPYYFSVGGNQFLRSYTQDARDIMGHGKWSSRTGNVVYALGGTIGYFDLGDKRPSAIRTTHDPIKQALVKGSASIGLAEDRQSTAWMGIDADYAILRTRGLPYTINGYSTVYRTENLKLGSVTPYLRFDNDNGLRGRVGVNVTFGSGYNARKLVTPSAEIAWSPIDFVTMFANAGGGQWLNPMNQLFTINPYVDPSVAYGLTSAPIVLRGGINVGPYDGMELGVYGGFAKVDNQLSPLITIKRNGLMVSSFNMQDTKSWYVGGHLGYSYQRLFKLSFDIKYGKADRDTHSWYEWIDAPKVISNVKVVVTPIKPMEVTLSYDMRYDRKAHSVIFPYNQVSNVVYVGVPNLGTVNNVNIGGRYQVTSQITAYMQLENVLNNHYKLISGMPAQGIHGLLGAAYKF